MPVSSTTPAHTSYYAYSETVLGDPVRAFVPAKMGKKVTVVWLLHAFGSSHDAIIGGYKASAEAAVDLGYIAVCPNLGGSLWSSEKAQRLLRATYAYLASALLQQGVMIERQIMVGTSHGGCMATYATGRALIPNIRGLYLVNAVYDTQALDTLMGKLMYVSALTANGSAVQVAKTNPAKIEISAFDVPIRLVYCNGDTTVPPLKHSRVFAARLPDETVRVHTAGHHTPAGTAADLSAWMRTLT